jgi:hypothetical protein
VFGSFQLGLYYLFVIREPAPDNQLATFIRGSKGCLLLRGSQVVNPLLFLSGFFK